jgi:hypothetical protein
MTPTVESALNPEYCLDPRAAAGAGGESVNILVAGGFDPENGGEQEAVGEFCAALGAAVVERDHILLNGCRTELDKMIATAAYEKLEQRETADADKRVVSYVLVGATPIHTLGTIIRSRLADWDLAKESFYIPESVREADVVILIGGFQGTFRAANWARIAKKPLLPFTAFGGAAAKIYEEEVNEFDEKYGGLVERLDYEELNTVKADWSNHAERIVSLAEKVAASRLVVVIMSYSDGPALTDAYDTFQQVCSDLGYECQRVTQENTEGRILPEILERIRRSAFVIVDLTELRPNVFYELGYADGLGKRVIVTAQKGTELPFDVKDIPTIFWEGQKQLREDLKKRIEHVVKTRVSPTRSDVG